MLETDRASDMGTFGAERGVGSIPTLASNLNRVCGKDLGFFHTRVPAEVPANNYPGSF
jgi:hypothetical protein